MGKLSFVNLVAAALIFSRPAAAEIIDLNELAFDGTVPVLAGSFASQGYVFDFSTPDFNDPNFALGVWPRQSTVSGDPLGATIFQNSGADTLNIHRGDGSAFFIGAIDVGYGVLQPSTRSFPLTFTITTLSGTIILDETAFHSHMERYILNVPDVIQLSLHGACPDGSCINPIQVDNLQIGFVAPPVPETATWVSLIFGFGVIGAALRLRRGCAV